MKKSAGLKLCNWVLLVASAAILISGAQLEIIHCKDEFSVWLHVFIGLLFMALVGGHIYLHFGKSNWFVKFSYLKSGATRVLWWTAILTLISGVACAARQFATNTHTPLGGIHGKLGFLMLILSIFHITRRIKFFKTKK